MTCQDRSHAQRHADRRLVLMTGTGAVVTAALGSVALTGVIALGPDWRGVIERPIGSS